MRRRTSIGLLAVGHACVDVYQGAVAALVPFFVLERDYTYAAASGIVLAASLLSSIVQPLFGALTDRWALPWLLPASTVLGGLGVALSGLWGSYALTLVLVAVSGIGVAAYHPEAARLARTASAGSHTAMAWFSTGGNAGFAIAPVLVGLSVGVGGLGLTPALVLPALAGAVLTLPVVRAVTRSAVGSSEAAVPPAPDDVASFVRMSLAVGLRSIAFVGLGAFVSLYASERTGGGAAAGMAALFVLYLGGMVGSMLGGALAQRFGRVRVARWSYLVSAVAVAGVVWVPGPAMYAAVALASIGLYTPFSLQITLGQDYLPSRMGTASGVTLGLAVSVGGLASPAIGALADRTSLQVALAPLAAMPLLAWALFCTLREPTPARRPRADGDDGPDGHDGQADQGQA
ncbi:MAG: MFS transporter [Actinomycetaceae bacterium]